MIRVWRFEDAPPEAQALSHHGGDEDYVLLAEKGSKDVEDGWWWSPLETLVQKLAVSGYHEIELTLDGVPYVGYITAHA